MYACPSCGQKTISLFRKWRAVAALPARCSSCGQSSAILIVDSTGVVVAAAVLTTLGGFTAVWLQSLWPLIAGLACAIIYYFWRQHTAQLAVVTGNEERTAKRSGWIEFLAVVLLSWFS